MTTVVFLFIFNKCYFTAVVSYFCKRFANQNAMYSRYGLYFRFTALQTVCKYDQLNEGKEVSAWGCIVSLFSFLAMGLSGSINTLAFDKSSDFTV